MPPIIDSLFNSTILKGVQILSVDNDLDSRSLYTIIFESCGGKVITAGSIQEALKLLDWLVPDILICEIRFRGESVDPLIQQIRKIALDQGKEIPILINSTCSPITLAADLKFKIEAYQMKPIDLDHLVQEVWDLVFLAKTVHLLSIMECDRA